MLKVNPSFKRDNADEGTHRPEICSKGKREEREGESDTE